MYCIKCGVKLADSEKKCPLCNTIVCHPEFEPNPDRALYPNNKLPANHSGSHARSVVLIILFLIPLIVCFFADLSFDGTLAWFGYVAGALAIVYIAFALPLWFKKPNPVIFLPCDFVSAGLYLLYINLATNGAWFLSFAFPITAGLGLITCTVVTLLYYLRGGKLYVIGGAFVALGAFMLLVERLIGITFGLRFIGWSIYPLVVLVLFGGLLIYFAINRAARETIERKLFF